MNKFKTFTNEELGKIRMLMIDNEPWFVGKDVAVILGYSDAELEILNYYVNEEDIINSKTQGQNDFEFGQRETLLINEDGLYTLIFAKLPINKKFKYWVENEILSTIHKTENYKIDTDIVNENKRLEIEEMEIRLKIAKRLYNLTNDPGLSETYKMILLSKSAELLTGENILPISLLQSEQNHHFAIGKENYNYKSVKKSKDNLKQ